MEQCNRCGKEKENLDRYYICEDCQKQVDEKETRRKISQTRTKRVVTKIFKNNP